MTQRGITRMALSEGIRCVVPKMSKDMFFLVTVELINQKNQSFLMANIFSRLNGVFGVKIGKSFRIIARIVMIEVMTIIYRY
jgi:hypothetical protein